MDKRYEKLEEALCKELEKLDKKYSSDVGEMTVQDVDRADALFHALKSAETYYAMKGSDMGDEMESGRRSYGRSYGRGRDSMGRYVSRDDGYSGHYPPYQGYPMSYGMNERWY